MTHPTELDRSLAAWLATSGPVDVPASTVDAALGMARAHGQAGRLTLTLRGRAWPRTTVTAPSLRRALLLGLLALLAVAALATSFVVGTRVDHEEQSVPVIDPSPLLERDGHRAIRLDDGRVLVVGGSDDVSNVDAALVDPSTGRVRAIPMVTPRDVGSIVTKLPDGRVLVAGGFVGQGGSVPTGSIVRTAKAEVFDPATETFSEVGDMTRPRGPALVMKWFDPVSVALADGRILIVGGTTEQTSDMAYPEPGDLFDPDSGTFGTTPPLPCRRPIEEGPSGQEIRSADLLPDGRVLISCEGWDRRAGSGPSEASVYYAFDVADGSAEPVDVGSSDVSRTLSLADRSVLLWERQGDDRLSSGDRVYRHRLLRYDSRTGSSVAVADEPLSSAAVTLLESGHVLFAGGYKPERVKPSTSVQVVDPCTGASRVVATLATTRTGGTVTQLDDRHVLLVGGQLGLDPNMDQPAAPEVVALPVLPTVDCSSVEVPSDRPEPSAPAGPASITMTPTGSLATGRFGHSTARLEDGRVLVVGGWAGECVIVATAELFDPASGTFGAVEGTTAMGDGASATLLADGRILIAGGRTQAAAESFSDDPDMARHCGTNRGDRWLPGDDTAAAYLFDPSSERIDPIGPMTTPRSGHVAELLPDGRVLIAGGDGIRPDGSEGPLASAELFDPTSGMFEQTGSMAVARGWERLLSYWSGPSAARLDDGDVLIVDGRGDMGPAGYDPEVGDVVAYGEVYSVATGTFGPARQAVDAESARSLIAIGTCQGQCLVRFDPADGAVSRPGQFDGDLTTGPHWVEGRTRSVVVDDLLISAGPRVAVSDPAWGNTSRDSSVGSARGLPSLTNLGDGRVLIAGGMKLGGKGRGMALAAAEIATIVRDGRP